MQIVSLYRLHCCKDCIVEIILYKLHSANFIVQIVLEDVSFLVILIENYADQAYNLLKYKIIY